ncbi:MAG: hypothetical protein VKL20_05520 [Synechocystis sp.]|nr:hypothetical protein [Synechocystis sp.]
MHANKVKPPFLNLPFLLVLGMGACVLVTGMVSYRLGDAALEGVTQPETNPTQKLLSKPREAADNEPTVKFTPVDIAKTAKETRIYIQNQQKAASKNNKSDSNTPDQAETKSPEADPEKKP